jgi:dGTPase
MNANNRILGCLRSSGRIYPEDVEYDFLEDKFRIINSKAFRRLEYKTQVFINYTGDHYRTRLTHSLEVSQIAVYIARKLGLNEELTEVIALSHDLGHPPFGHAGEYALNDAAAKFGGFDHNVQGIKIVVQLEKQFPKFNGLNLTLETLDGILKHNGVIDDAHPSHHKLKPIIGDYPINFLDNASLESQIASLADDIAYSKHDIDDGIRAGFITLKDFCQIDMFKCIYDEVMAEHQNLAEEILKREVLRNFGKFLIEDLLVQTQSNIAKSNITHAQQIIKSKDFIAGFSESTEPQLKELKKLLFEHVYRNFKVNRITSKTKKIIQDLFAHFMSYPTSLPQNWQQEVNVRNEQQLAVQITDYIAGMTDRFAVDEHKKIFDIYYY